MGSEFNPPISSFGVKVVDLGVELGSLSSTPPISSFGVKVVDLGVELWGLSSTPQSAVLALQWLIWGLNCGVWVQPPNQQFWRYSGWFGGWTVGSEFNHPISSFGVKVVDLGVELRGLSSTPQSAVLALKWLIWGLNCGVWAQTPQSAVVGLKWLIWGLNCGVWVQPPNQQFWI